jgi:CheY-like chemotaxis protein
MMPISSSADINCRVGHDSLTYGRVPIVFVSASAEDARSFREIAGDPGRLIVNVPDVAGALATIQKLQPALVACDTELEGHGSWRDLAAARQPLGGFALIVISPAPDAALSEEVLQAGGLHLLGRPFALEEVVRAVLHALPGAG